MGKGMGYAVQCCTVDNIMSLARSPPTSFFYALNNTILLKVSTNPYLGIRLSDNLKWTHHSNTITKKANCTLWFLRRNLRRCPTACKRNAYLALVRLLLEYRAVIWDPYLKQDIDKMEQIQRNAARFIARDYTYKTPGCVTGLLHKHYLQTLQEWRERLRLTFMYSVVEGLGPTKPADSYLMEWPPRNKVAGSDPADKQLFDFVSSNQAENYIWTNNRSYTVPHCNTEQYKHSLSLSSRELSWPGTT